MKSLVLGGAGFVGSAIVDELIGRGMDVRVLTRGPHRESKQEIEFFLGDCRDGKAMINAMVGCDAVLHTAAYYPMFSVRRERQAEEALHELRVVLDAVRRAEVSRFVFTSSPMALIDDPRALRTSTYHYIKRLLHEEVLQWVGRGLQGIVIVPGACFGPGDRKPTTGRLIVEIARRRLRFVLEGKMNAVDVRDVARGQVESLAKGKVGECYQFGNWNCTLSEFARFTASVAHVPPPRFTIPYGPAKTAARLTEWLQQFDHASAPLFPESGVDQIHFGVHLDSSDAIRDLGFQVRPMTNTLRDTLEYFREGGYLTSNVPPRH